MENNNRIFPYFTEYQVMEYDMEYDQQSDQWTRKSATTLIFSGHVKKLRNVWKDVFDALSIPL